MGSYPFVSFYSPLSSHSDLSIERLQYIYKIRSKGVHIQGGSLSSFLRFAKSSDFSVFIFSLESISAFFTQALKSARVKGIFISWKLSLRLGSLIGMCEVLEGKLLTSCVSEI